MAGSETLALEIWSPLPPEESGVADYVHEQLEFLERSFRLTLVVEDTALVDPRLKERHRVIGEGASDPTSLRLYHVGNSPRHGFIYRAAIQRPGVVLLHEWNLHELLLSFAVVSNNFDDYRRAMRREHGERGSIAAETLASALGGKYWSSVFPLNAEILQNALGVVCLSGSTARKVGSRIPGRPLLSLDHHAVLKSKATNRTDARRRLGLDPKSQVILAPGLQTASKSFEAARAAVESLRSRFPNIVLVTVGGGSQGGDPKAAGWVRAFGRVDLETLGDSLLAADVVLALRFPSRGETSGVLMRSLAASRATVVSSGSSADEDLPEGVVARVSPGVTESRELAKVVEFLLTDPQARQRLERLAGEIAAARTVESSVERLAAFLREVSAQRETLEANLVTGALGLQSLPGFARVELEAVSASLGLTQLPSNVFEKLASLK